MRVSTGRWGIVHLRMLPQIVSFGPLTLNLYTLLIALASLISLAWAWAKTRDMRVLPAALAIALVALACGRALYVALNWDYFREHAGDIASLAGLSEHGAIVGAVMGYWLVTRRVPLPASVLNAQCSIAIAASIGCIPNGCAYGREVFWQIHGSDSLAWRLHADWPDAYSVANPRWPTQALLAGWMTIAAVGLLVAAPLLERMGVRRRGSAALPVGTGRVYMLVGLFAAGDFLVQFLRGDPAPLVAGLRIYQWFDLALLVFAGVLLTPGARRPR